MQFDCYVEAVNRSRYDDSYRAPLHCAPLEPRILMSATPAAAVLADVPQPEGVDASTATAPTDQSAVAATDGATSADGTDAANQSQQLVFVDPAADGYQQLIDDLVASAADGRQIEVFTFDPDRDGIEQVTEILNRYRDVDAIHIVSHGTDGQVKLGNTWLSSDNFAGYAGEFAAWGRSLSAEADLLIYGCELASSATGEEFIDSLSVLTGADVAASDDNTGHATFGGDWILEYATGVIETDIAFSIDVQQNWTGLLATTETHYFLTGGGIPEATLDTALPTATAIPDYDNGRHAPVGTLVSKGGTGFGETDPVKHQLWQTASGSIDIDGPVQLNIWTHIKDFSTTKGATVHAYLIDIKSNGTDAQLVASDTISRGTWNPDGDWVEDTFDFGSITRSLAANRLLQVKVVVDGSSDDGMVFGYDGIFHRSHLRVGMTTSNGDPVLTMGGSPLNYFEGDGAREADGGVSLTDDDASQQWATVRITGNYQSSEDRLTFTDPLPGGISMQTDTATGQIVFYGASSFSDYETVFKKVRYENISEDPSELTRTVTFQVYDGQHLSTGTQTINVTAINDDPTVNPTASGTGLEDQNLVYTHAQMLTLIGAGDVDNTNAELTVNISGVNNATFSKSGSGNGTTYTFTLTQPTHANGYNVTFNYEVVDTDLASISGGPATITIQAVNDEPVLTIGGDQNVDEDTGLHLVALFASALPGGGVDELGQTFTYTVNNNNAGLFSAAPTIDALGNLSYTLAPDAIGTATVTVSVQDSGGTASGGDNTSPTQQFDIIVANANNDDAVVAVNNGLSVNEDATETITAAMLRVDDPDLPPASTLVYTVTSGPALGRLELTTDTGVSVSSFTQADIDTGRLQYVHLGAEAPLTDSFDFTASDGIGSPTAGQTFSITISNRNDAPLNDVPGTQTTLSDTSLVFSAGNSNLVSVSDSDAGGSNVEVTLNVTSGTVTLDPLVNPATPLAGEFSVASNNTGIQSEAKVASLPDGRYVVVWSGNGNGDSDGIFMRQYNADGISTAPQTRINGNGAKSLPQSEPSVAVNASGRIVVSWTSDGQDAPSTDGVYFRAMNWDGTGDTGEIAANETTAGNQSESVVAIDAAGNVIVVWTDKDGLDGHNDGVFARRFNSAGTAIDGTDWQIATAWGWKQHAPDIAMNGSGQFVITWKDSQLDGSNYGIFAKRYDASGNPLDAPGTPGEAEFQVNASWDKEQSDPSVGIDDAGNFVVVWQSKDQDGSDFGIYGQLFDSGGNAIGPGEFLVNTTTAWHQKNASVAMDANGDFAVVWEHETSEFGPRDIHFQQFGKNATRVGTEQTANSPTTGEQYAPDIAMDANGNFVIVWDGQTTTESDDGVVGRQYALPPSPLTFSTGDGIADNFIRFQGSLANINAALDGMVFTPTPSFTGVATVNVNTYDMGNSGPGGPKSDNDNITINVNGANTPIGSVSDSDASTNEVAESATVGAAVGITASATDPDAGDTVTYSLANDASGLFTINGTSGVVTVAASLDYELATSHNIVVRATSSDSSSSTQGFTISVNPVNDNNPVITSNGGGAAAAVNVTENTTSVTTVAATDADLPAQTLVYSISGGADAATFNIDGGTGVLTFIAAPDFESPTDVGGDNVYDVQVQVSDGVGGVDTQDIAVTVVDVFEGVLVVDTTADVLDGNVTSATALLNNRGTDGKISLREAIAALNNTANAGGPDEIHFNIADTDSGHLYYQDDAATGTLSNVATTSVSDAMIADFDPDHPYAAHSWFRIDLDNALPQLEITDAVIINGYTQAGASQNTLSVGNDARLRIELTNSAADSNRGLTVEAGGAGSSIFGLVINGFTGSGILTEPGADNVTIQGNFIGTDVTGTIDLGNGDAGVHLRSGGNLVGGTNAADRNLISGNDSRGVTTFTFGPIESGNVIRNNYIGTDATGVAALGNSGTSSVQVYNNDGLQLIDNVIGAGAGHGVRLMNSSAVTNTVIQGNLIGMGADGTTALGNADHGIWVEENTSNTVIGGLLAGEANTIAHNGGDGVAVTNGTGTSIRGNAIFSNTGLGIDLDDDGVTGNDVGDSDGGPNARQNFPVLTTATSNGSDLTIDGSLNSVPLGTCQIDFYASTSADPSAYGEAKRHLGSATVATDASGDVVFSEVLTGVSVAGGEFITGTATDASGNTSEFAQNVVATATNVSPVITSDGGGALAGVSVTENATAVTTVTATDADLPAQTLTFGISGGADAAAFTINSSTGVLTFVAASNFETPADAGGNNVYDVQVQVSDGVGGLDTQDIAVTVSDVNESNVSAISDANGTTDEISESAANGTTVGLTALAADPDGTNNTITYSLDNNAGGRFAINAGTGVVTVANTLLLDYESTASHSITVRAAGSDGSFSTAAFSISVLPANDHAPVFTSSASISVPEMTPNIVTLTATDADLPGQSISFTIVGGDDAALFNINGADRLQLTAPRNFEVPTDADLDNVYEVDVQADDGAGGTTIQSISVTITDANDAPTGLPAVTGLLVEDQMLTADTTGLSDEDGMGPLSYQWRRGGVDIAGATGSTYTLGDSDVGANITVVASYTDGGGTNESVSSAAVGPIANANDAPTITALSDQVIPEDGSTGPIAFGVGDTDTPVGLLTVTASSSDPLRIPHSHILLTDLGSGNWTIEVSGAPDQHGGPVTVAVTVDDGTAATIETFRVVITAVNDAPQLSPVGNRNISEDVSPGTSLLTVSASDVDAGDTLSFAIVAGNTGGAFSIAANGTISVAAPLDHDATPTYVLTIQVTDSGTPSLTDSVSVTIFVDEFVAPSVPAPTIPAAIEEEAGEEEKEVPVMPVEAAAEPEATAPTPPATASAESGETTMGEAPVVVQAVTEVMEVMEDDAGTVFDFVIRTNLDDVPEARVSTVESSVSLRQTEQTGTDTVAGGTYQITDFHRDLQHMREEIEAPLQAQVYTAAAAVTATGSLTVGYVLWAIRGGWLVSSVLAQMPAWRLMDPLVVLSSLEETDDVENDDSLQAMLEKRAAQKNGQSPAGE
ncbi:MAG: cadherin domain-containing protein [Fuerstiella sp.]